VNLLQRILRAIRGPRKRIGRPPLNPTKIAAIRGAPDYIGNYELSKLLGVSYRSVRKYRNER
jgi:hypothetical protein